MRESNPDQSTAQHLPEGDGASKSAEQDLVAERTTFSSIPQKQRLSHTKYVRIYKEYHSVCPLVGIGTPPTPLSPASVTPRPPDRGAGGHTRLRVMG
jgi:hypothetical protein